MFRAMPFFELWHVYMQRLRELNHVLSTLTLLLQFGELMPNQNASSLYGLL
jgi:hypothetical protein